MVFAVDGAVVAVNRQRAAGAERNDRQVGGQVDADGCVRGAKLDNVIAGATGDRGERGAELLFRRLRPRSGDVSSGDVIGRGHRNPPSIGCCVTHDDAASCVQVELQRLAAAPNNTVPKVAVVTAVLGRGRPLSG